MIDHWDPCFASPGRELERPQVGRLCQALGHDIIVHRDQKPDNVMMPIMPGPR